MRHAVVAGTRKPHTVGKSLLPNVAALAGGTIYLAVVLQTDSEWGLAALFCLGVAAMVVAVRTDFVTRLRRNYSEHERVMDLLSIAAVIALACFLYNSTFALFLLTTVFTYIVASLGLNIQFGYAGMLNFAGAAMLGVGGYAAALLGDVVPRIFLLPIGGMLAAVVGSVLLPPMLRTQGHYSAVVTIAFNLLFVTFLEAYSGFGGTQGLSVHGMRLLGLDFNENWKLGGIEIAFYFNYFLLILIITIAVVAVVRRMERSWIGLSLDAIRLDERSAECFGINITLWKTTAFTVGNFIIGLAGAFYALMIGYIAPNNFTFGDSLILVTIIILGGLGSIWGAILTAAVVIILPEKLQVIQEYRFLIYAIIVTMVLLFRPAGLLPRVPRIYFPGWRP